MKTIALVLFLAPYALPAQEAKPTDVETVLKYRRVSEPGANTFGISINFRVSSTEVISRITSAIPKDEAELIKRLMAVRGVEDVRLDGYEIEIDMPDPGVFKTAEVLPKVLIAVRDYFLPNGGAIVEVPRPQKKRATKE